MLKEQDDYKSTLDETIIVNAEDWFENSDGYLNKIDFEMRNYNNVLTILIGENFPNPVERGRLNRDERWWEKNIMQARI